jgi:hypothetical protein
MVDPEKYSSFLQLRARKLTGVLTSSRFLIQCCLYDRFAAADLEFDSRLHQVYSTCVSSCYSCLCSVERLTTAVSVVLTIAVLTTAASAMLTAAGTAV